MWRVATLLYVLRYYVCPGSLVKPIVACLVSRDVDVIFAFVSFWLFFTFVHKSPYSSDKNCNDMSFIGIFKYLYKKCHIFAQEKICSLLLDRQKLIILFRGVTRCPWGRGEGLATSMM